MSEFVLNRNHTHRSVLGYIINFKKGEPVYVPPACHKEVAAFGAEMADGSKIDVLDPEKPAIVELTLEERKAALVDAFKLLQERNNRGDFTGQGIPSVTAMKHLVTFELGKKEIEAVWREYLEPEVE